MSQSNPPLIAIVGQTASGKTALAIDLAMRFNGEIIAADSRTVYRGMDIGTAKPTKKERVAVPHHLLDVVDPDQPFTVSDFQKLARRAIDDITSRGKVPFLVGGSGLYIDSVIYNFSFRAPADPKERHRLEMLSVEELQRELVQRGLPLPPNPRNSRHLIRSLETGGEASSATELRPNTLVLGLSIDADVLKQKLEHRVDAMVAQGFIDEVRLLANQYGWGNRALQAPGYRAFHQYIEGKSTLQNAKQQFVRNDYQYARRQKTWFKRSKDIHWISNPEESVELVTTFMNK
jgi:tRNA dimethylallyltransferase